ncbi:MAG: FkbM family methyltransferase [Aeromicrobium sp.]|nr:FkbM family methyltransferase [Burkholderiales bacterium]
MAVSDILAVERRDFMTNLFKYLFKFKVRGRARLFKLFGLEGFFFSVRGFDLFLDPYDYVDAQVCAHGYYEPHVLECIKGVIEKNNIFWDIGGNIGLHSFAIKHHQPDVEVFCFEPNPLSMKKIMKSRVRNNIPINILSCALGSALTLCKLSIKTQGNSGLTSLSPWPDVVYEDDCHVVSMRADHLIKNGFSIPNVVKMDVEGYELQVLKGFGDYLFDPSLRAIIFEDNDCEEIHAILKDAGFLISNIMGKDSLAAR